MTTAPYTALKSLSSVITNCDTNTAYEFDPPPLREAFHAIIELTRSTEILRSRPFHVCITDWL